ncbi:MAG: lipoyl-dependent peroxiredoxin [Gaiellaceae bacterium]|nr:lipoyl-dependent peroxiredoxin [Gaiellaceae bacterium]
MPRIERSAKVEWEGNVARGQGTITADTGAFSGLPFTLASRIGNPEGKTSPEELLAAATAGCFAMSLGSELVRDGTPAGRLEVHCRVVMDEIPDEGHQIVGADLTVHTEVEGASDEALAAALERADAGCPFSILLKKASASVTVSRA